MLDRVVYVSGVHGGGKSTLIRRLSASDYAIPHQRSRDSKIDSRYQKEIWRLANYMLEAHEQEKLSGDHPDGIVLADRCALDSLAYLVAHVELGWATPEQAERHRQIYEVLFDEDTKPKNVIFLCSPLEWTEERIRERFDEEPMKRDHDDAEYLRVSYEGFIETYSNFDGNLLVMRETDLDKRVAMASEWLRSIRA